MEQKKHYKIYKSSKMWVSAAVATLALTAGMAVSTNASADADINNNAPAITDSNVNTAQNATDQTNNNSSSNSQSNSNSSKSAQPQQVTVSRTVNYSAVDAQNKESKLPDGVQATSQQDIKISQDKDGKWQPTTIPEQSVKQIDGYYTKVNGQWSDKIPSITITDPNQKLTPISVVYVQSQQVVKPTDEKDEKQKDLFGTVDYTIKYQAPNGISLPDGIKMSRAV